MSFFAELKRRNVFRVGIAYAVIGWFLAQLAEFAFENFDAPPWVLKSFVVVLLLGLPVALFFAWAFELIPEGVKRESDVDRSVSITHSTGRKLDFLIIAAMAVALAYFVWERQGDVATAMKIVLDEDSWQRMQEAGVRNVDAFIEYQKGKELFELAHGNADLMATMREGLPHFDRAIELVPAFAAAYWQKSDYYGHILLDANSTGDELPTALQELQKVLDAAYRLSVDSPRRLMIDVDRVLFSNDWTLLRDRIEKALATSGCPEPTWIEMAIGFGYAEDSLKMWQLVQRCEPLNVNVAREIAGAAAQLGQYQMALDALDAADVQIGTNARTSAGRQRVMLMQGKFDEALAIAPAVLEDTTFFGMSAEALPLAMSGNIDAARAAMERWQAQRGHNLRNEIEIHAAMGDRETANRLAAEVDARPGGTLLLLLTSVYCACGAPFDIDATPNFQARIRESGIAWPLETLVRYPAKDW